MVSNANNALAALDHRHLRVLDRGRLVLALPALCIVQVFGRRNDGLSTRRSGRRPKSAEARNRGMGTEGGAAGAMYSNDCKAIARVHISPQNVLQLAIVACNPSRTRA